MLNFIYISSPPLFYLILLDFIALSIGLFALRNVKSIPLNIKTCSAFGVGFLFLSLIMFFEGICGLFYSRFIATELIILFLISVFLFVKFGKELRDNFALTIFKTPAIVSLFLFIPLFLLCLLPPTVRDELVYHLAAPKLYLQHHRIFNIEGNVFAAFPEFTEMLYIIPIAIGEEALARLLHLNFCILSSITLYFFARQYLSKTYSLITALFLASSPVVFSISGTAYIDMALAFYVLLSFVFLNFWLMERSDISLLIFSGIFAGSAMAIKYTGMWVVLIMITIVLLFSRSLAASGVFALSSVAIASPWYLKNYLFTGNPFYPFFYSIFGGKAWDSYREAIYIEGLSRFFTGSGWIHYLLFPVSFSIGMKPQEAGYFGLDGIAGIFLILMIPAAVYLAANRQTRTVTSHFLIFLSFFFFIWFFSSTQTRLFLPALPAAILIIMIAVQNFKGDIKWRQTIFSIFIAGSILFNLYHNLKFFSETMSWEYLRGKQTRAEYLRKKIPETYPAIEYINRELLPDSKVWLIWMKNQGYYFEREHYSDSIFESFTMESLLSDDSTLDKLLSFIKEKQITHILIDENLFLSTTPFDTEERTKELEKMKKRFAIFSNNYSDIQWQKDGITLYRLRFSSNNS
ncbi:MAG: glycosyltransferase family 39 protein [Candidatus Schekmanbacteria bacterium]|nr:glycosyltransferase family 39 protein [Candidatus Schekmanbacteria bacterium]